MKLFRERPTVSSLGSHKKSPISLGIISVAYFLAVIGIILGIRHNAFTDSIPIPPEHIPVLIPFFVLGYVLIVGPLWLIDRLRKRKR
jgi:hypothetical protein